MRIHDGAYGTLLHDYLRGDETVDDLCIRAPALVVDAHRAYLDSGAQVIQTNAFLSHVRGSSRRRMQLRAAAHECVLEAIAAVATGESDDDQPAAAWTIGPAGDEPRAFWETIEQALEREAGIVLCETVTSRGIADALIAAWADVARGIRDVELLLGCSTDPTDRARSGWIVELASEAPQDVLLGLNCCEGPLGMRGLLEELAQVRGRTWAMPSAGLPTGDPPRWPLADPDAWAEATLAAIDELPVVGVGGCCGTGPDAVAALAASVRTTR
ncbi:MAG: homocysteine S-methyltransferase family protein [Thermoleophilia bacterium]|nr:homocysteine S-methyltransferase family protein [Thermoleophilia bacterium]